MRTVTFDRIGRNHAVPPLQLADDTSNDALAVAIYDYARTRVGSRDLDVVLDVEDGKVSGFLLVGAVRSAGAFQVTA